MKRLALFLSTILTLTLFACAEDQSSKAADFIARSQSYQKQGQYRAAMIEARNAVQSDPESEAGYLQLADLYIGLGAGKLAEDAITAMSSESTATLQALAEAFLLQGKYLSAGETLSKLSTTDLESAENQILLARTALLSGDAEQALAILQAALTKYPSNVDALVQASMLLLQRNEVAVAITYIDRALTLEPNSVDALYASALALMTANKLAESEDALSKALLNLPKTDIVLPQKVKILKLLANNLTQQGKSTEALVYTKLLAEANPEAYEAQEQFDEALDAIRSGDTAQAEEIFQRLVEINPNSANASTMLGLLKYQQGQVDEAAALLTESVDAEIANANVVRLTALAQIETGRIDEAIDNLQRALLAKPDDVNLLSIYGTLALSKAELQTEGYTSLQKALAIDPERSRLRLALARYHISRQQSEQALAQLRVAFSKSPSDWPITEFYVSYLINLDQLNEARTVVNKLINSYSYDANAHFLNGVLFDKEGRVEDALVALNKAVAIDPSLTKAQYMLGKTALTAENYQLAQKAFETALQQAPDSSDIGRNLAEAVLRKAGGLSGMEELDRLVLDIPSAKQTLLATKALILRQSDLERAVAIGEMLEPGFSSYVTETKAELLRLQALGLAREQQYGDAERKALEALQLLPGNLRLQVDLAQFARLSGKPKKALELLDKLNEIEKEQSIAIVEQAQSLRASSGVDSAYSFIWGKWTKQPSNDIAFLTYTLAREVKSSDRFQILKQWVELPSSGDRPWILLGDYYLEASDTELAVKSYQQALVLNPNNVIALNNLAWLLQDSQSNEALEYARLAAENAPSSAAILDTYGWLLHKAGRNLEALAQLNRAQALDPENAEVQEHLATVKNAL